MSLTSSLLRKRRWRRSLVIMIFAGVVGLTLVTGLVVGATILLHSQKHSTPAAVAAHWSLPSNEVQAPLVPTPGGASMGDGNFNAISCDASEDCVAVGGNNGLAAVAAYSPNGGVSWVQGMVPTGLGEFNAVSCVGSSTCVAGGIGAAAISTNGGISWTPVAIPTANTTLLGVSCASSSLCASVGVSPGNVGPFVGQVLVTSDGGHSWFSPKLPVSVGALASVDCPTSSFCVAVGAQILVTTDGGSSWTARYVQGGTGILRSVSCVSSTTCVAIGDNPLGEEQSSAAAFEVATTDGGLTWTSVAMPAGSSSLSTISCSTAGSCTASGPALVGSYVPVLTTQDAGATWANATLPSDISAVNSLNCQSTLGCVFTGLEGGSPVSGTTEGATSGQSIAGATSIPVTLPLSGTP
jgi:photosystem II stability/assembly factor-like uncharacterized protein